MNVKAVEQLVIIQAEVTCKGKSKEVAYALWFFVKVPGGQRFYSGQTGIAIGQLLTFGGLGFWALFDVFAIRKAIY
ncbi:TM2 domain-containing protein [Bacillus subtilis]|uniref:TM2 domain-containing protein n=1 Tax=Bacillus subtilis TaxID=1423 RepID=UPI0016962611|nr:TM2 domain-containing protein [Bacillus subtilis]MBU8624986.1 TM2 domain-containing protein [Bacillus subtilis]NLS41237.1 TM2 domain-containing protein [Bacillus subtilis]